MPRGRCAGCGEDTLLPPFGEGLCFLCATDGPSGARSPTGRAVHEGADARREARLDVDLRQAEIAELFAEASARRGDGRWAHPDLSVRGGRRVWWDERPRGPSRKGVEFKPIKPDARSLAMSLHVAGRSPAAIARTLGITPWKARTLVPARSLSEAQRLRHVELKAAGHTYTPPTEAAGARGRERRAPLTRSRAAELSRAGVEGRRRATERRRAQGWRRLTPAERQRRYRTRQNGAE